MFVDREMNLLDLSWEDLLHRHVLAQLSLADLFRLRAASRDCQALVDDYFYHMRTLDVTPSPNSLSREALEVLVSGTRYLRTFIGNSCSSLDDELLQALFHANRNLQRVSLRSCQRLSPKCLQPLIMHCKGLRVLDLSGCPWIKTDCLEALTRHQGNLEEVHLESCSTLGDDCLESFFRSFTKMRAVHLAHLHSLTDRTLHAMARYCRSLRHFEISNCSMITDEGVVAVAELPELEFLRVAYCVSVVQAGATQLTKRFNRDIIADIRPKPPPGWCIPRFPRYPGWVFTRKKSESSSPAPVA